MRAMPFRAVPTIGLLFVLASACVPLRGAGPQSDPLLDRAKELHEKRMAKIEADFEKAKQLYESQKADARQDLIRAYDAAIKRNTAKGELELANALLAQRKALEAGDSGEQSPLAPLFGPADPAAGNADDGVVDVPRSKHAKTYFRSVLGSYRRAGKDVPFVNVSVPKANLWSERVQSQMRGKIDLGDVSYRGTAKIYIPKDGEYYLEAQNCAVKIDGKDTGGSGAIVLKRGAYEIEIEASNHGQPYLLSASAAIYVTAQKKQDIPMINSLADIEAFLLKPVDGARPIEVSGWKPKRNDLVGF
jgi:hypothetical protein